ncbi:MAG: glycoside hydrolase family 30 beta sandwich domain-containing protein [Anaerolineae bacterium]
MAGKLSIWLTSEDAVKHALERQPDVEVCSDDGAASAMIRLEPVKTYQTILGMGSSFEEASVYHLMRMDGDIRQRVLRDLVSPVAGAGWNLMRICFGSSDFTSVPYYSYDDMPPGETDPELAHFSIQRDVDLHIVDLIREAMALNPDLRVFASTWSLPAWMKSGGSMCGGYLLREYYGVAARYYRRAIQEYGRLGIPIHAVTLQNEPGMIHRGYPTSYLGWAEELALLLEVRQEFERHGLDTHIWIFDHNFDEAMTYPGRILADPAGRHAADGVAFHDYEGKPTQMGMLSERYPDVGMFLTEHSTWGTAGMDRVLQYLRNGARSYNAWVTCLNDVQEPNPGPHGSSPTFVTVNRHDPNEVRYIPEYHLLAQFTRFVRRGARRIASNYGSRRTLTNAAFVNPEGDIVVVVVNQTLRQRPLTLAGPGWRAETTIPAKAVATLVWNGGGAGQ